MSNKTVPQKCEPLSGVPLDLPIPKGINYGATQGRNGSEPWMVKCCAPNPVSLVDGCYVWCELPKARITTLPDGKRVATLEAVSGPMAGTGMRRAVCSLS